MGARFAFIMIAAAMIAIAVSGCATPQSAPQLAAFADDLGNEMPSYSDGDSGDIGNDMPISVMDDSPSFPDQPGHPSQPDCPNCNTGNTGSTGGGFGEIRDLGQQVGSIARRAPAGPQEKNYSTGMQSNTPAVKIRAGNSHGSGAFVRDGRSGQVYLMTAFHVIDGTRQAPEIWNARTGQWMNVEVDRSNVIGNYRGGQYRNEAVFLPVSGDIPDDMILPLRTSPLQRGEALTVHGFPGAMGLFQHTTVDARVTDTDTNAGWAGRTVVLNTNGRFAPQGMSGGPILDTQGHVVGVLSGNTSQQTYYVSDYIAAASYR